MAQETGTQIVARARTIAQDDDANSNYGVSDTRALALLNDIAVSLTNNVRAKTKWIGATNSGLVFTSGLATKLTTADIKVTEIESFHPSNSATLSFPVAPALLRVSVQEMMVLLNYDGDNALASAAAEWTHVAAEKAQNDTASGVEAWRVWGYPVINRTRYMTIKAPVPQVVMSDLTETPDIDSVDSILLSRILAYEMARLKKDNSQSFLDSTLRGVPKDIVTALYGSGVRKSQLQDGILQVFQ